MQKIIEGVSRFQREVFPRQRELFADLADHQCPRALFITCADSRIVPDMITQTGPGQLFIIRNAGNIVPTYGEVMGGVSATIEYALVALNIRNVILCGHSDCGAMKGLLHPEKLEGMPTVKRWLRSADAAMWVTKEKHPDLTDGELLRALTEENVVVQMQHLRTHPSVAARVARGDLDLYGWVYEIDTGRVFAYDEEEKRFAPLVETGAGSVQQAMDAAEPVTLAS